ncbi:MAG TPA: pyruvate dehydrogenase complex dihydrolipoamide acetyltransferase [Pyrinomonadaceae bacterium]|nr:pyruvate dehydrogenase complex dihydrolipoamide acetyltransferase [Pyrinomonadaceae bacterium]
MATQVVMPKLSPTMEEGQISRWLKQEGDKVSMGEPLAEIDTDKATMEMQALGNGVLRKIIIQAGESAPLGQLIAVIGEPDEDISALLSQAGGGEAKAPASPEQKPAPEPQQQQQQPAQPSGNGARAANGDGAGQATGRLVVSPLAARMAAEAGINLRSLTGSGPGGRIIKRDIEAAISAGSKSSEEAAQAPQRHLRAVQPGTQPAQAPAVEGASAYRDEPTSVMRQTIARRLVTSIGPVPHFFLTTEIEMDRVVEMRNSVKDLDPEMKFSINDVIVKVAAAALIQHPQVNASFQDRNIRYYEHADIGVAVAIEDGLITPVVRAADQKSLSQIAAEVKELAGRARSRKLLPEEYTGATFSISNLGMLGIDEFTAVINPPEAAILAVGAVTAKAVVRDNQVVVRQMMRVTMSCDHRVIDGATGARFLQTFKRLLENPLLMIV